jgi:hypothetical protein
MKNKLLYLIILLTANSLFSQTNVGGGLFSDTVWSTSGSPYVVTSDVALFPGNTLTIEPGVTIKFNSGTKLILRGTMISSGTSSNVITFTSNSSNPTKGSWVGIELENSQGGKIIASHIKAEYADNFIQIMNSSSGEILNIGNSEIKNCNRAFYGYSNNSNHTVILDNLNINNNTWGYLYAQNITLTNSLFSDGERGIYCWENICNISISNSEFFNFSFYALGINGVVDNCDFHDNAVGIRIFPDLTIKNSTIEFNIIGLQGYFPVPISGVNIFDNKICDNSQYNFEHQFGYPINLSNNCWCSNIESEISQSIFDAYDDPNLGIMTFMPFNDDCSSTLSTENFSNIKEGLSFYPNPAKDEIIISENVGGHYEIYSINGIIVKQGIITEKLNISELSTGLYLLKISNINLSEFSIKKLIKK